jgi:heme A synthase
MTTTLWLRISSVIALLFAAGHALGGLSDWSPMQVNPVIEAMRTEHFDVMGVSRSYLDFYQGFGNLLTVTQLLQAALLWQLATLARSNTAAVRPMIAIMVLASVASCVITWRYIVPVPAVFSLVLLASLTVALLAARRAPTPQP